MFHFREQEADAREEPTILIEGLRHSDDQIPAFELHRSKIGWVKSGKSWRRIHDEVGPSQCVRVSALLGSIRVIWDSA